MGDEPKECLVEEIKDLFMRYLNKSVVASVQVLAALMVFLMKAK